MQARPMPLRSVRLSSIHLTFVYSVKTNEHIFKTFHRPVATSF